MINKFFQVLKKKNVINHLTETIDYINFLEKSLDSLQKKLKDKEELVKQRLTVNYKEMEDKLSFLTESYARAPFHLSEEEYADYKDFCENHRSQNEKGDYCSYSDGFLSAIIFHYNPLMSSRSIMVECPFCHTKRMLGTSLDILPDNEKVEAIE